MHDYEKNLFNDYLLLQFNELNEKQKNSNNPSNTYLENTVTQCQANHKRSVSINLGINPKNRF